MAIIFLSKHVVNPRHYLNAEASQIDRRRATAASPMNIEQGPQHGN